jgi:hypothetical protein
MIGHLTSPCQRAAWDREDWLDLDRLAREVAETLALQLLCSSPYVGLDGDPVIEAESARALLALEEIRT